MPIKSRLFFNIFLCSLLSAVLLAACTKISSDRDSADKSTRTISVHNETSFDYTNITLTYNKEASQTLEFVGHRDTVSLPLDTGSVDSNYLTFIAVSCETKHGETASASFSGFVPSNLSFTLSLDESGEIIINSNIEDNE